MGVGGEYAAGTCISHRCPRKSVQALEISAVFYRTVENVRVICL